MGHSLYPFAAIYSINASTTLSLAHSVLLWTALER